MNARWSIWDSHKKMQTWLRLGECDMVVNFLDQAMFIRSSNYTFHWNHNEKPLWYLFSPAQVAPIFSEFQGMVVNSGDLLISLLYFMPLSCLSNTKCAYNGVYYCPCGAHGCSRFAHGLLMAMFCYQEQRISTYSNRNIEFHVYNHQQFCFHDVWSVQSPPPFN